MTAPQSLPDSPIHSYSEFPEPSIDLARLRLNVEAGGARWLGMQEGRHELLVLFNDPVTGNTLSLRSEDVTAATVSAKVRECRIRFERGQS